MRAPAPVCPVALPMSAPVPAPIAPPTPTPFSVLDILLQPHTIRDGTSNALPRVFRFIGVTPDENWFRVCSGLRAARAALCGISAGGSRPSAQEGFARLPVLPGRAGWDYYAYHAINIGLSGPGHETPHPLTAGSAVSAPLCETVSVQASPEEQRPSIK